MIALTGFDVNDQVLNFSYKVVNRSNHDVWICDSISSPTRVLPTDYEVYMDDDARSLVIRRQIEVRGEAGDVIPKRYNGRYVLLHPGKERTGSFSLGVPVARRVMLAGRGPDVAVATRVVLKIGFYDEDLPGKIRSLLDLAGRLGTAAANSSGIHSPVDDDLYFRYFPGFSIAETFGGLYGFSSWTEGSEQINIPFTAMVPLGDESCLQIAVDGVLIPIAQ